MEVECTMHMAAPAPRHNTCSPVNYNNPIVNWYGRTITNTTTSAVLEIRPTTTSCLLISTCGNIDFRSNKTNMHRRHKEAQYLLTTSPGHDYDGCFSPIPAKPLVLGHGNVSPPSCEYVVVPSWLQHQSSYHIYEETRLQSPTPTLSYIIKYNSKF